jgi:DNA topoisomerase IA
MTNSAHDNIEIYSYSEELSDYKDQLDRAKIRPNRLYDVLTLIQKLNKAEELGSAELKNYTLTLTLKDKLHLKFNISYLNKAGWLEEFVQKKLSCVAVGEKLLEDYKDIEFLEDKDKLFESYNNSELTFRKQSESSIPTHLPQNMTVDLLLRQMDLYGIGRPSTYASTFKAMRENGFITINEKTFEVRMTKAAFRTYCLLKEKLPELYRADFSTWLYILQRDLEQNNTTTSDILSSVCERVLTSEQAGKAINNLWENIDDFYPDNTKSDTAQESQIPQTSCPIDSWPDSDKVQARTSLKELS